MHDTEKKGLALILPCLRKLHQVVSKGRTKTFDLSLDGSDAELKAKGNPFSRLDFITYTENQHQRIQSGPNFDTFIICGVKDGERPELYRLPSDKLREIQPSRITTIYEYDKNAIKELVQKMEL